MDLSLSEPVEREAPVVPEDPAEVARLEKEAFVAKRAKDAAVESRAFTHKSETHLEYKAGFCVLCGAQTMIRDGRGRCSQGIIGTTVAWIVLSDPEVKGKTRVGPVTLCEKCDPYKSSVDDALSNLCDSSFENVTRETREVRILQSRRFEVIKRFGD